MSAMQNLIFAFISLLAFTMLILLPMINMLSEAMLKISAIGGAL